MMPAETRNELERSRDLRRDRGVATTVDGEIAYASIFVGDPSLRDEKQERQPHA
jgi:hypothetical protein